MVTPLLLGYLFTMLFLTPRLLRGASWTRRAPRLGITLWLAACLSTIAAFCLVGVVLVLPVTTVGHAIISLVLTCAISLHHVSRTAASLAMDAAGASALAAVAARLLYATATVALPRRRLRRQHAATLRLLGRHHPSHDGVLVVAHPVPAVYCLPARGRLVVVSEGALSLLDPPLLDAVIAHEHAHLRGRHYLITTVSAVLARAFPGLPLFAAADIEIHCLVEMAADDSAARRSTPGTVARALLDLVAGQPPASVLAMAGGSTAERVRRLLSPHPPLSLAGRYLAASSALTLLVLPIALPAVPAYVDHTTHCPPAATATSMTAPDHRVDGPDHGSWSRLFTLI
ncbi:peptidase M48 Ste24p [Pseudofrankia inefficax]|uniref:Peptidase M48 Ste24p n=1 Tax=Pseudofrankia inefficax (strain DSM 45817 / CECT 9037 / DDB 130130 / EuI1c) TaxID=298654 RepID=E3J9R6_PSEI1|nr:peptidase M48 Ste24p [Pseudofrankia inefficax]